MNKQEIIQEAWRTFPMRDLAIRLGMFPDEDGELVKLSHKFAKPSSESNEETKK